MHLGRTALLLLALSLPAGAGTPGIFRGTLMHSADGKPGWVYIQSRNGSMRRVEITHAQVTYANTVPARERAKKPSALQGAEVRVTAEQDGQGEWRARQIEILKLPPR